MSQEGRLTDRLPGIALFLARLYVGYWFLLTGIGKIKRGFLSDGALLPQLERFAAGTPHAWYKAWLESIVIPHEHLFAALVALGETLAGAALLLGILTRVAAGTGIFMVGNFLFAKGWSTPGASHDKDFIILLLVVLIGGAGKHWGIDGWLRRRRT
ncbi:MAG: DoxX family protein [Candidatus Methylomirabilota bacterium]